MSLTVFVIRRLLATVLLVPAVMLVTFALLRVAGGSPFRPPEGYPLLPAPTQRALEDYYNLDEPWFVEFAIYLKNVFMLDFGPSQVQRDLDVNAVMRDSFPVTLELVLLAVACAVPLGIGLGVVAATHRTTATSRQSPPQAFSSSCRSSSSPSFSRNTSCSTGTSSRRLQRVPRRRSVALAEST